MAAALHAFRSDPLSACSPEWQTTLKDYGDFHANGVRALAARDPAAPQVLVYLCVENQKHARLADDCAGYADRIVSVAHLFIVALRLRMLFFVSWNHLSDVAASPYFDWTWNHTLATWQGRSESHHYLGGCAGLRCPLADSVSNLTARFSSHVNTVLLSRGASSLGRQQIYAGFTRTRGLTTTAPPGVCCALF